MVHNESMQLHHYINTLGQNLQYRYGEKIHKLTLHGGFSCPNRDGTIGKGGCTFCNVASFADEQTQFRTIKDQLAQRAQEIKRAKRYLAYFQAYTSTYAEMQTLKKMYAEALVSADIVGLCIGTRPDCVSDEVLQLLSEYHQQGYEIWLELGLQTASDKTLKRINRGHSYTDYDQITKKARNLGLKVCTHLIIGLPGETDLDNMQTLDKLLQTGTDGIKLHPLHIVEGSTMGKAWHAGRLKNELSLATYTQIAGEMIMHTPAAVIYHAVSASARRPTLLTPLWCESRWDAINAIGGYLDKHGVQGCAIGDPFTPYANNN